MENSYDVIIAGGGLAGILAAVKLHQAQPDLSILLLEKEAQLGGRLRRQDVANNQWNYGFYAIHAALFDEWDQLLKTDPEAPDLPTYARGTVEDGGILAAQHITPINVRQLFSPEGARAIAGGAAERDWVKVEQVIAKFDEDKHGEQNFAQLWPGSRKDTSTIILHLLGNLWGVPDIWSAHGESFMQLLAGFKIKRHFGDWHEAISRMMERPGFTTNITIKTQCRIGQASVVDGLWRVNAEQGIFAGKHLVVAIPPWEALAWLSKEYMPQPVIQVSSRVRPVSVLSLGATITQYPTQESGEARSLPHIVLIPAEQVQVMVNPAGDICFQATLDYELTLQAPDVVKAVKRLRRAHKKFFGAMPGLVVQGDHIALKPVGWSRSLTPASLRLLKNLQTRSFQTEKVTFCGDAYGPDIEGDLNIISSVHSAVALVASSMMPEKELSLL